MPNYRYICMRVNACLHVNVGVHRNRIILLFVFIITVRAHHALYSSRDMYIYSHEGHAVSVFSIEPIDALSVHSHCQYMTGDSPSPSLALQYCHQLQTEPHLHTQ